MPGQAGLSWSGINANLAYGFRGLPGGQSLAQLLEKRRGVRNLQSLPPLSVEGVLAWADAHYQATSDWPHRDSGPVRGAPGETWEAVYDALYFGGRGLPGHTSLPRILAAHRGVRNRRALPTLSVERILGWADEHYRQCGAWPKRSSGTVAGRGGETWSSIDEELRHGGRGLPGGSSLARLLAARRGARNLSDLPRLTIPEILNWADEHRALKLAWPKRASGVVIGVPGETWESIDGALRRGTRGLPRGSSLAKLLLRFRGVRRGLRFQVPSG